MPQTVQIYRSNTKEYHDAFQVFLNHTDQKTKAKKWLEACIAKLQSRKIFIDAGAGNGKVTEWFTASFARTIAFEPNDLLRQELKTVCPAAEVFEHTILEAGNSGPADFVLSSHVFYYINQDIWLKNLERLASWLSPAGTLVVILQNHETDCMKMLSHFFEKRFNLKNLAQTFKETNDGRYEVSVETVPASISAPQFDSAYTIAEFMLNLLPLTDPPARSELEAYIEMHFTAQENGFRFSCDQDFLQIRRLK